MVFESGILVNLHTYFFSNGPLVWCHDSPAPTQAMAFWLHGDGDEPVPHRPTDQTNSFPFGAFRFSHTHQEENIIIINPLFELAYIQSVHLGLISSLNQWS